MGRRVIHRDTIIKIDYNRYQAEESITNDFGKFRVKTYLNETDLKRINFEQRILDLGGTEEDLSLLDEIIQDSIDTAIAEHEAGENL